MDETIIALVQKAGVPAAFILPAVVMVWLFREFTALRNKRHEQLSETEEAIREALGQQVESLRRENHNLRAEIAILSDRVVTLTEIVGTLREYISDLRVAMVGAQIAPPPIPPGLIRK